MSSAVQNVIAIVRNGDADQKDGAGTDTRRLSAQQRETAQYVADMILELRNMSKAAKLFTVTVPLEYAYYEAFSKANQVIPPQQEVDRLNELAKAAQESENILPEDY